ncbi:unnamed protein product [Eruca vesicaria subsp. sativa]|uniref:SBP-type domain-containing protein n=1 Tax=Eruca vesicaria subsp. sativa TaxID=29727 RepID=A0ABC8LDT6_ERUVS|nr:unnamed protein product [Eruca vesicaria subsp. sativa]
MISYPHLPVNCNMRSQMLWDWDNLIISNPENDKNQLTAATEWETEGIESIFPCFDGLQRLSNNDSTTSFWHTTSVSKSSQSTSTNSSSPLVRRTKPASERGSFTNIDFVQVKKTSTALEVSAESDLSLKLGKRTYSGRDSNDVSKKLLAPSHVVARKKSKSCGQSSMQVPRCQIDGCELDLSSAKDYHRKHRVCETHSKCPNVTVNGVDCRFCQQCSRLHDVSEFDEKKRSCRKRLSHHNARRRKSQGFSPSNPERVYDHRQHTNIVWGTTYETKPTQTESGFTLSFQRGNGSEEQLFASSNHSLSAYQTSGGFSAGKDKFQLGVGEHSGELYQSQDFHRAFSLLSTSSGPLVHPHAQPLSLFFSFDGVPKQVSK